MGWLFHKKYSKKQGKDWTRKALILQMAQEMELQPYRLQGSTNVIFGARDQVKLAFMSNNYADPAAIDINADITLHFNGHDYVWADLFHLVKSLAKTKRRPLLLYKDQAWEGSGFQKDVQDIIAPLVAVLLDASQREAFLSGKAAAALGRELRLSDREDDAWIKRQAATFV